MGHRQLDAGLRIEAGHEPDGAPAALRAKGLTKSFGSLVAVRRLDLTVQRGEVLALLGPNGAGKTTTVRMLCGLLRPDGGTVEIDGRPVAVGAPDNRRLGVCPQKIIVWDRLTCLEQLSFVGVMYGLPRAEAHRRAERLLSDLGLADKAKVQARKLSGGMQRRLNLALGLVHEPDVVFLDEPEAGLDPQSRVLVREYIRHLAATRAVLLTTHNMDEADRLATRVVVVDHGAALAEGTPAELKRTVGDAELLEVEVLEKLSADRQETLAQTLRPLGTVEIQETSIALRCAQSAARLAPLLQALSAANIRIGDVRLRQPTLEDVFLKLTGRRLRE